MFSERFRHQGVAKQRNFARQMGTPVRRTKFAVASSSIVEMVFEVFARRCGVANRAAGDRAGVALQFDRLLIVRGGDRGADRVWTAMARRAVDVAMSARILEQSTGFLKVKLRLTGLVAAATGRFVYPGRTRWIGYRGHIAMARSAEDPVGKVDVSLTVGLEARMARIANVA